MALSCLLVALGAVAFILALYGAALGCDVICCHRGKSKVNVLSIYHN